MNYSSAFDLFWQRYGQDDRMDQTAKGSKRKAFESWQKACSKWCREEKIELNETKFAEVVAHGYSLHANNRRNARRVPGKFVAPLPMVSTYLNQFRFEAEVNDGSGDLRRQADAASRRCQCGGEMVGIDAQGKPICRACHIEDWYDEVRRSTDINVMKWRPKFMMDRYPKAPDESWAEWSRRTTRAIMRDAPATSPLKWRPGAA